MLNNKQKESSLDKLASSPRFKSFMRTVAMAGFACAVVGLLLKMKGVSTGANLLIIGISVLAIVSFFLAQLFPYPATEEKEGTESLRPMWMFAMTLTGYALAVALFGLLFLIMHWPGGMVMLTVGVGTLVICALVWLYIIRKKNSNN